MMNRRCAAAALAAFVVAFSGAPHSLRAQGTSPIDDLIKRAINAFDDLNYSRADSLARSVLQISTASAAQRVRAQAVQAAANFPEEAEKQHRATSLATLKQLMKLDYTFKMPTELTWAGLDSLVEEARRTTFGMVVSGTAAQTSVGFDGTAKLHVKSNKPGMFRLIITSKAGSAVAIVDSISGTAEGDITFKTMRDEKPIFTSGDYNVMITAFEPGGRGDTVTTQFGLKADAPPIEMVAPPTKMDSTKLLKERSGKFGAKAILPAILVGAAGFFVASALHGDGALSKGGADGKGIGVAGGMFVATILAGYMDHGRVIPENVAANKAAGEAYTKGIADATTENRKRVTEYKTTLTFDLGGR